MKGPVIPSRSDVQVVAAHILLPPLLPERLIELLNLPEMIGFGEAVELVRLPRLYALEKQQIEVAFPAELPQVGERRLTEGRRGTQQGIAVPAAKQEDVPARVFHTQGFETGEGRGKNLQGV